jgi:hypothetical protein
MGLTENTRARISLHLNIFKQASLLCKATDCVTLSSSPPSPSLSSFPLGLPSNLLLLLLSGESVFLLSLTILSGQGRAKPTLDPGRSKSRDRLRGEGDSVSRRLEGREERGRDLLGVVGEGRDTESELDLEEA